MRHWVLGLYWRAYYRIHPWFCPVCGEKFDSGQVIGEMEDGAGLAVVCDMCSSLPDIEETWNAHCA